MLKSIIFQDFKEFFILFQKIILIFLAGNEIISVEVASVLWY